jgi:superoxide reductase
MERMELMNPKFYVCKHCGNIIAYAKNTGVPVMCCGEKMVELVPGATDGAKEKHVPVLEQDGDRVTVRVGSQAHPMGEDHSIEWILLHTTEGNQRKCLKADGAPEASFRLSEGEKVVEALAYCNLHGLWATKA